MLAAKTKTHICRHVYVCGSGDLQPGCEGIVVVAAAERVPATKLRRESWPALVLVQLRVCRRMAFTANPSTINPLLQSPARLA